LLPITRKVTACRMNLSSSQDSPTHSVPCSMIHDSTWDSPVFTYSPLLKEQHLQGRLKCVR
jgi:hypothetical protein